MKTVGRIDNVLSQSRANKPGGINKLTGGKLPRFGGAALSVGLVALPAFTSEGGIREKTQAVAGGIAAAAGPVAAASGMI